MSRRIHSRQGWRSPLLAGLLIMLLLLLGLIASSEQLHAWLHTDSPAARGACAVCALAKGQLDTPIAFQTFAVASISLVWIVPGIESGQFQSVDLSVASSRGPPVPVSSL